MKKTLLAIASVMMLCVTGCDKDSSGKVSPEDYPSGIVGWWEFESAVPDEEGMDDGYRWLIEFGSNDVVAMYDNVDFEDGNVFFSQSSVYMFQYQYYWISGDRICDKDAQGYDEPGSMNVSFAEASEYWCSEFGNPNCECNIECESHRNGSCHYTKIVEMTSDKLVFEMHDCGETTKYKFVRTSKPSKITYKEGYQDLVR